MADVNLVFTQHAKDMLIERGIDRAWLETTVLDPEAIEPDPKRPGVVRAFRRVPEHGGRTLRVVYAPAGDSLRILTVFFDRKRQQRQSK